MNCVCMCVCLQLERFLADHDPSNFKAADEVIEQTRINIQWVNENKDILRRWFERESAS